MELEEVERAPIRKKTQKRECFRFTKQKSVIDSSQEIDGECDNEVDLGPEKGPENAGGARTKAVSQHQEDNSNDDARMGYEEADEPRIGKAELQIGRDNRLQRSADTPEIGYLKPSPVSATECDDDYRHRPIAQLHRQCMLPTRYAEAPRDDEVSDIIDEKQPRNGEGDGTLQKRRLRPTNDQGEEERERNR